MSREKRNVTKAGLEPSENAKTPCTTRDDACPIIGGYTAQLTPFLESLKTGGSTKAAATQQWASVEGFYNTFSGFVVGRPETAQKLGDLHRSASETWKAFCDAEDLLVKGFQCKREALSAPSEHKLLSPDLCEPPRQLSYLGGLFASQSLRTEFVDPFYPGLLLLKDWAKRATPLARALSGAPLAAIDDYCQNNSRSLKLACKTLKDPRATDLPAGPRELFRAFSLAGVPLPVGSVLFQGGKPGRIFPRDVEVGDSGQTLALGSTAYLPSVALHFAGPVKTKEGLVLDRPATDAAHAKLFFDGDNVYGDVAVFTVAGDKTPKGIFRQPMDSAIFQEAEIVLQPGIRWVIKSVRRDVLVSCPPLMSPGDKPYLVRVRTIEAELFSLE